MKQTGQRFFRYLSVPLLREGEAFFETCRFHVRIARKGGRGGVTRLYLDFFHPTSTFKEGGQDTQPKKLIETSAFDLSVRRE